MNCALVLLLAVSRAAAVVEYVALTPVAGGPAAGNASGIVKWARLEYSRSATAVGDVAVELLESGDDEHLGAWFDLDLTRVSGGATDGAALSAKVLGETLFVLLEQNGAPADAGGGCCADTLAAVDRATGAVARFDLDAIVRAAGLTMEFAHATHTFDVEPADDGGDGARVFLMVQYFNATLNANADAIVAFDTATGAVAATAAGLPYFDLAGGVGVVAGAARDVGYNDTVYRVEYYTASDDDAAAPPVALDPAYQAFYDARRRGRGARGGDGGDGGGGGGDGGDDVFAPPGPGGPTEEWHGNGVLRFASAATGSRYLAFTHRMFAELVVLLDPWTYAPAAGGGEVVQRFGTPAYFDATATQRGVHAFGLDAAEASLQPWTGGVHNAWYTPASATAALAGAETLTLFVNSIDGEATSFVYEFAFRPVRASAEAAPPSDATFATASQRAACAFTAPAQGGARAIADGVYLVGAGAGGSFLELVDARGGTADIVYPGGENVMMYDSFARVVVSDD